MEDALKVLFLEDTDFDIDLVKRFIASRSGFELTCLGSESEALQFLKSELPDIFLVHTVIQGDAVHNLVEMAIKKGLARVVIPVAAGASLEELRFYKGLGCSQILSKPFTIEDLAHAFDSIIAQPARVQ